MSPNTKHEIINNLSVLIDARVDDDTLINYLTIFMVIYHYNDYLVKVDIWKLLERLTPILGIQRTRLTTWCIKNIYNSRNLASYLSPRVKLDFSYLFNEHVSDGDAHKLIAMYQSEPGPKSARKD